MVKLETMTVNNTNKFDWNVCGHENIVHFLQSAISSNNLAHAYLFHGNSHLGKSLVADKFVASLLCESGEKSPCGVCVSCRQVNNGIYPDFYTVKREMNEKTEKLRREIVIEQIRQLKAKLQQGILLNSYKIAMISEANLLNANSANALLKILEEPTKNTIIILICDDITMIPETISSRCQSFKFLSVATPTISHYLSNQGVADPESIARQSYGKPGMAIAMSNSIELVGQLNNNISSLFESIGSDITKRFYLLDGIIDWSKDEVVNIGYLDTLLFDWQSVIRDIMLIKSGNESLVANIDHISNLEKQASSMPISHLKSILNKISQTRSYVDHSISSKSALENLIINL